MELSVSLLLSVSSSVVVVILRLCVSYPTGGGRSRVCVSFGFVLTGGCRNQYAPPPLPWLPPLPLSRRSGVMTCGIRTSISAAPVGSLSYHILSRRTPSQ